jgi:tetratricopeptide (TPR) repeat protein
LRIGAHFPTNGGSGQFGASQDMATDSAKDRSGRTLNSWKEIAAYLGRDERTAKRWERTRGLPVRRLPGPGHVYVFAYVDEIKAWLNSRGPEVSARQSLFDPTETRQAASGARGMASLAAGLTTLGLAAVIALSMRGDGVVRGPSSDVSQARATAHSPLAIELYRDGLHEWQSRTPSGLAAAISDFNRAIGLDPNYAPAYVGLADAYNLEGEFTAVASDRLYPMSAAAARKALALDPTLASAHAALAFSDFYGSRDVAGAHLEFARALKLDPRNSTAHHWYATFLMTVGDYRDALVEIDRAAELDSVSSAIPADKALILFHAGQRRQAVKILTQLEKDQPGFAAPHRYLAAIWLAAGDDASYLEETRLGAMARGDKNDLALVKAGMRGLARGGHLGMLRASLGAQRALYAQGRQSAFRIATTFALLRDVSGAFSFLTISVNRREPENIALGVDSAWDPFRGDPRFAALASKAGLAAASQDARPYRL